MKISFGIIVLNGEPFTKYCIRALYKHAHEIIVVEGACFAARGVSTEKGHSRDNTLEIIKELKENYDPLNRITLVTAENEGHPDGFWPGEKHEQSRAYAKRSTGDYIWQVDIDEFYLDGDIERIKKLLLSDTSISCVSFRQFSFWGGFEYYVDSWYFKRHLTEIYRIFKWAPGYEYVSHRPPTVADGSGIDLKKVNFLSSHETAASGIYMYHYSFVFPKQIDEKVEYYNNVEWSDLNRTKWWAEEVFYKFRHPFKIFILDEYPGWLCSFKKKHPQVITELIQDIQNGTLKIKLRETSDIEKLLASGWYTFLIFFLKRFEYCDRLLKSARNKAKQVLHYAKRYKRQG